MIHSREDLNLANRIVIKAGTSVVSTPEGFPSLSRMANIVEHAANLVRQGKEVMIVTSGAVGVGKQRLSKQAILHRSMSDIITQRDPLESASSNKVTYNSACAAAGQLGLMALYETMFNQFDITVSQLLVTSFDFTSPERRRNIQHVISQLLSLGIVPLLNENDAVSANQGYETFGKTFSDNDSLASLVAVELSANLLILLTDVKGVYDRPPTDQGAQIIDIFTESTEFKIGNKSLQGRGGMGAKVDAAMKAIHGGVESVIIAAGHDGDTIGKVLAGEKVGTLFLHDIQPNKSEATSPNPLKLSPPNAADSTSHSNTTSDVSLAIEKPHISPEELARLARDGSRVLSTLSADVRTNILRCLANKLEKDQDHIIAINELDLADAERSGLSIQNKNRLKLTKSKITSLCKGILSISEQEDPINHLLSRKELTEGLILDKISCPIGVLLIIFESRPDCLPQIASLAIRSGNGLILKGGKEADKTNAYLYDLVCQAIVEGSEGKVPASVIGLVKSRDDVNSLLKLDKYIDLVIPRGSNELVSYIQSHTMIPVLGHADGVCHIYLDKEAKEETAERIVYDAKLDYPSACNATETVLIHSHLLTTGFADRLLRLLRSKGIAIYGGPKALKIGLAEQPVTNFHTEYGDLKISIEVVESAQEAIDHINQYSSGHTECIVTENSAVAEDFLRQIDSACVFHNASTRFSDGYRFGLGAEVGIATGRIHARGPVGVEGLLTTKWLLRSHVPEGHIVAANVDPVHGPKNAAQFTHKSLPVV